MSEELGREAVVVEEVISLMAQAESRSRSKAAGRSARSTQAEATSRTADEGVR